MKYFAIAVLVLSACPVMMYASTGHSTQSRVVPHHVVAHPATSHYTQKSQKHEVVKPWHPRYVTNKAQKHKVAHAKHKKVKRH